MEILNNILFWLHLVSLSVGGAASFGIPVVGAMMPTAPAEARPTLFKVMKGLSTVGRGALVGLIVTGPLLVWLKYGGTSGFTWWFWLKMVLVVILIGLIAWAGINARRAESGDMEAIKRGPMIGGAAMLVLLGVIFTAVFAFG
jgi:protoporphyrinogen IX oxidase